jgi:hypothetical protein
MRIERIVMTGDVFRTSDGDANQLFNVRWLHGELSPQLHTLTGLRLDIGYRHNAADDGRAIVTEWYEILGHVPSIEAWAATHGQTAPPPALVNALRRDYEHALVIGFELSPLLCSILDAIGAPWIDVEVSPIRFLEDLALAWRFSWPVEMAHPALLGRHDVEDAAQRVRARYGRGTAPADPDGACIFLGQTRHDRTLIKDGAFFPDNEAVERVAEALDGRRLLIKPHPLAPDNPLLSLLSRRLAAPTTDANIYTLLATARDVKFLTISSSAAIEARHFGHTAQMFHSPAHKGLEPMTSLWAHRSAAFWRAALGSILPLQTGADFEERAVPDRLRRSLGAWGWPPPDAAPQPATTAARTAA